MKYHFPIHEMKFKVTMLSPEMARELLAHNHPDNRQKKDSKINQYFHDIQDGLWKFTHQAIAQDVDGYLIDGQNRCEAVILADTAIPIVLVTGVPKKAMLGTDYGAARSVLDAAKITGQALPHSKNSFVAVARKMAMGNKAGTPLTSLFLLQFIKTHEDALVFAFECMPKTVRGLTHASVRAVIARAYYRRNCRSRIREFCEVFISGLPANPEKDKPALLLRNWLIDNLMGGIRGRRAGVRFRAQVIYGKAERALDAFVREETITSLYESKKELYPIPGDGQEEENDEPQLSVASA